MKDRLSILKQVLRGCMIAVLIATAVMAVIYAFRKPPNRHDIVRTLNDVSALEVALVAFEFEYAKLPNTPSSDFELEGPGAPELITVLLGKEDPQSNVQNPRQIMFLTVQISSSRKRGGLVFGPDKQPEGIYDFWGNPLRVILRPPGQSTLTITHAGKQVTTSRPVIVLSRGRDGKWGTKDDLMSNTTP